MLEIAYYWLYNKIRKFTTISYQVQENENTFNKYFTIMRTILTINLFLFRLYHNLSQNKEISNFI